MIKAVLFDLEGTLVDFQWNLQAGERELRTALEEWGFPASLFPAANYARMWNTAVTMASPGIRPGWRERLTAIYDRYDLDALTRWSPRPGARELLTFLRETAVPAGLVTNVGRAAVSQVMDRFGLRAYFSLLLTRNDVTLMKPEGEGITKCLAGLKAGTNEALFVGDSITDILASRSAGVRVAIVAGGETGTGELLAAHPDYWLSSLLELKDFLPGS
ncbi:MAG TPA: HAD-IA family hydrolase [Spirochaetia bacterium]|nr:HAD-IA family hydrolase [Spirochaetia bacterium]